MCPEDDDGEITTPRDSTIEEAVAIYGMLKFLTDELAEALDLPEASQLVASAAKHVASAYFAQGKPPLIQ